MHDTSIIQSDKRVVVVIVVPGGYRLATEPWLLREAIKKDKLEQQPLNQHDH